MPETTVAGTSRTLGSVLRASLALMSVGAGVVHLAAAAAHHSHPLTAAFFVVVAGLQVAWAAAVVTRPTTRLLLAGLAGNALVLAVWMTSRTVGMPLVPGAARPEALGVPDTVCALFEVVVMSGVSFAVTLPAAAEGALLAALPARRTLDIVGLSVMLLTVPAVLTAHHHDHAGQAMDMSSFAMGASALDAHAGHDPAGHASGGAASPHETASAAHVHDEGSTAAADLVGAVGQHGAHHHGAGADALASDPGHPAGHVHDPTAPDVPATAHVHDASTCHPTPQQQAAANKLIADTKAALARWKDQSQALADGFVPYPPVPAGWAQHYVNFRWLESGRVLDPKHPESLLYAATDDGFRPISALYILPHAWSKPPDTGGCLTHWHTHPELFLSKPGESGSPPMLHVFVVPMAGGPFAHEPDPRSVRALWAPWRDLVNPWWEDGCGGAPALPGDPYQAVPSCRST